MKLCPTCKKEMKYRSVVRDGRIISQMYQCLNCHSNEFLTPSGESLGVF